METQSERVVLNTLDWRKRPRISRPKFQYKNKVYTFEKEKNHIKYSRCKVRSDCAGRLNIKPGQDPEITVQHKCMITTYECDVMQARNHIKDYSIANPFVPPSKVILETQHLYKPESLQAFPREDVLKTAIRQYRKPLGAREPTTRLEIMLDEIEMSTTEGLRFLYHDSQDEKRILIFSSDEQLKELNKCAVWCIDGTFDVVSGLYAQLLTIHGVSSRGGSNFIFPLVLVLLPDKRYCTYKYVYEQLRTSPYHVDPEMVLLDFEAANMKAITEVFPSTNLQGCHFHFVQSLYRNFGSLMKKEYDSNYSFALFMKSIFGLPFVHIDDVRQAFDLIVESSTFTDGLDVELDTFFQYLYRNYVGDEYVPSKFAIKFWNVHDRVKENLPRTNNSVESWHRRLTVIAEGSHPPLYRLLKLFRQEEKHTCAQLAAKISGAEPVLSRYNQRKLDCRLLNLVNSCNDIDLKEFVLGISYNMTVIRRSRKGTRGRIELHEENNTEVDSMHNHPILSNTHQSSIEPSTSNNDTEESLLDTANIRRIRFRKDYNNITPTRVETRSKRLRKDVV